MNEKWQKVFIIEAISRDIKQLSIRIEITGVKDADLKIIEAGAKRILREVEELRKMDNATNKLDRLSFKAKNILGEWVYAEPDEDKDGAGLGLAWKRPEGRFLYHPIVKKTLCQCTGIRDSDGRLIYEHDIIEAKDVKGIGFYKKSEILWDGCEWSGKSEIVCSIRGLIDLYEKGEITIRVIGNKYDKEATDEH